MKIVFCIACVLVCFASGLAQEKSIDRSEFDALTQNSNHPIARWPGKKSFRRTTITESRAEGVSPAPESAKWTKNFSTKSVSEYAIDSKTYHFISETSGEAPQKRETVKVGGLVYTRVGSGPWTKTAGEAAPKTPPPYTPPPSRFENLSTETSYAYLGTETYKNATVRTYQKVEKRQMVNKETGKPAESVATTKLWIAEDGTLLRTDFKSDLKDGELSSSMYSLEEFELDPSITITAPEVS